MQITLPYFSDERVEELRNALNKHARVLVRKTRKEVIVECEGTMIECQKVVIISDLYWGGGKHEKKGVPLQQH